MFNFLCNKQRFECNKGIVQRGSQNKSCSQVKNSKLGLQNRLFKHLLEYKYDTSNLTFDAINRFKLNLGYSLVSSVNGVDIKLSDPSLSVSMLGLQASATYKSE